MSTTQKQNETDNLGTVISKLTEINTRYMEQVKLTKNENEALRKELKQAEAIINLIDNHMVSLKKIVKQKKTYITNQRSLLLELNKLVGGTMNQGDTDIISSVRSYLETKKSDSSIDEAKKSIATAKEEVTKIEKQISELQIKHDAIETKNNENIETIKTKELKIIELASKISGYEKIMADSADTITKINKSITDEMSNTIKGDTLHNKALMDYYTSGAQNGTAPATDVEKQFFEKQAEFDKGPGATINDPIHDNRDAYEKYKHAILHHKKKKTDKINLATYFDITQDKNKNIMVSLVNEYIFSM